MLKRFTQWGALALALILLAAAVPARAESVYALVTGTGNLEVRATPDSSGYILGQLPPGYWVEEIAPVGEWYYVRVVDSNLTGYVSGAYLSTAGQPGGSSGIGVVSNPVPTQHLNLRQFPSYSAPVLGVYYNGQTCQVLSLANGWYNVVVNGQPGYFKAEFIKLSGDSGSVAYVHTMNGGKLNMRSAPSLSGAVIGQYAYGTQVNVILKGSTWWKVSVNGAQGFMEGSYLQTGAPVITAEPTAIPIDPTWPTAAPYPTYYPWPTAVPYPTYYPWPTAVPYPTAMPWPTSVPTAGGYCIVSNANPKAYLNLRAQPSTSAKVLAQYYNGIRLEVLEQGETWCKVYGKASGKVGYVMTKYVTLHNLPAVPLKTVSNGSSYVNLRSTPNKTGGNVRQQVPSGTQVTVLIPGDTWTKVRCGFQEGYMMTVFLK